MVYFSATQFNLVITCDFSNDFHMEKIKMSHISILAWYLAKKKKNPTISFRSVQFSHYVVSDSS